MRAAVFSCKGLGDGLLALILSHNLQRNGWQVDTFHSSLSALQSWFPHLPIQTFPQACLENYDRFFLIYETSPWMQEILKECKNRFWVKTTVLNPIATPHCDYPYWEHGKFNGRLPFAENLYLFCKEVLKLPDATKENGIQTPCLIKRDPLRVVIHPTSSRSGKNWTKEKYEELGHRLEDDGLHPVFVLAEDEKEGWKEETVKSFSSLQDLAAFVAGSSALIGNDSGIGHLASCLGLPTLTICRSQMAANFWRPGWSKGEIITPPSWVPNLKGLRIRDRHWQKFISVKQAHAAFKNLYPHLSV